MAESINATPATSFGSIHRVGKRIHAAHRVARENIGAGDIRGGKKAVHVGGELMRVLETRRLSTPTLAGAIEDTDARLGARRRSAPKPSSVFARRAR